MVTSKKLRIFLNLNLSRDIMKMSQVEIVIWSSERALLAKNYLMIVQNNFTPGI